MAGRVEHGARNMPAAAEAVVDGAGLQLDLPLVIDNESPLVDYVPSEASDPPEDVFGWGFAFDSE